MAFATAPGYNQFPFGNFSPTIFSKNALIAFRKVSVVPAITNTAYSGEIAQEGQTVNIIKESDVAVGTYVRGQQLLASDLLDDQTTLTVDHCNYFMFALDDIEKKQTHIDWMKMQQDRAAYKLRDAFDSEVLTYMATNAGVTSGLGTTSAAIVIKNQPASGQFTPLDIMSRLNRLFDENNVPTEDRFLVATPHFWELMQGESSKLMAVNFTGDAKSPARTGMYNGKVIDGDIRGFSCHLSNNLPTGGAGSSGSSGTDYASIIACHRSSTATASQIADTEVLRSPDTFADICRGKHLYGRKALRTEALGVVYWNVGA